MKDDIVSALKALSVSGVAISLESPADSLHGDYSTSVALAAAKIAGKNPKEFAEEIATKLRTNKHALVDHIEIAGHGFINFFLSRDYYTDTLQTVIAQGSRYGRNDRLSRQKVMVEYTDPNPFKEFHIGHLMSNTIGECISRLIEYGGADVKRACYQGDVGLHVAKAIWGMQSVPSRPDSPLDSLPLEAKARYLGHTYQIGAAAYEHDEKEAIEEINRKVYDRSDTEINGLYDWGRKVSLDYFEEQYKKLGTKFDFYFFESEMAKHGLEIVRKFLGTGLFEESDGAVVFRGEKYNPRLHTRVYRTSQGLPTYEAKELGLHFAKAQAYTADLSVVITANEQDGVFEVGLEAFRQIDEQLAGRIKHLSHGMLRLPSGKMSSRKGEVITADTLIGRVSELVREKVKERAYTQAETNEIVELVGIAAIKYSILRQAIGGDIIFDFEKSISFEGDSGPYLQYAATRAQSVLLKAEKEGLCGSLTSTGLANNTV